MGAVPIVEITSYCPKCYKGAAFASASAPAEIACSRCGERRAVGMTESVRERNLVDRCVLCGCGHLYIEKDFNGYLGMAIVAAAIVGSALVYARDVFIATGILAAAALVDFAVWRFSRERTVCYRCVARYRGAAANPAHGRYELGIAGRFADDFDEQRGIHQGKG
jgi:uncharacterized protein (DUF983 family)